MRASARRFIFGFFLFLTAFLFLALPSAQAQTPQQNPDVNQTRHEALGTDQDVPSNLHTATQIVMIEAMSGILCQITGKDYVHPNQKCLGVNPQTGKIGYVDGAGGMIGAMGTVIGYTLQPPISSRQYISYLKGNFGISKSAYAADKVCDPNRGIGFCGLWPIVDLWIAMRNIVYLIFILVFVIIGLGIMLRLHIDPQTVMSVQNQIPKIIIGIVAITFSFAIAGLLIDIMWVATWLFASVLTSSAGGTAGFKDVILAANPFDAANSATGGVINIAGTTSNAFANLVRDIFTGPANAFNSGDIIMGLIGNVFFVIINFLAWIIIGIAIIIALIRLWFILLLSYLNIILDVVFAPFWILAGVAPGSPISLGSWLRDVIANLAVFPLTVSFFILARIFIDAFSGGTTSNFVPPLVGGVDPTTISALIGLGFLLSLPNLLTTTKAALKAPKLDFGPILGPITGGGRAVASIPSRTFGFSEKWSYANRMGLSGRERFLATFGNPLYYQNKGGGHASSSTITPDHSGGAIPKSGGSSGGEE